MKCLYNLLRKEDYTGISKYVALKNKNIKGLKIKGDLLRILGITCHLLTCYLSVTIPDPFLDHSAVQRISQLLA